MRRVETAPLVLLFAACGGGSSSRPPDAAPPDAAAITVAVRGGASSLEPIDFPANLMAAAGPYSAAFDGVRCAELVSQVTMEVDALPWDFELAQVPSGEFQLIVVVVPDAGATTAAAGMTEFAVSEDGTVRDEFGDEVDSIGVTIVGMVPYDCQ